MYEDDDVCKKRSGSGKSLALAKGGKNNGKRGYNTKGPSRYRRVYSKTRTALRDLVVSRFESNGTTARGCNAAVCVSFHDACMLCVSAIHYQIIQRAAAILKKYLSQLPSSATLPYVICHMP